MSSHTIAELPALVAALPAEAQDRFQRLFHLDTVVGELVPPARMTPWIEAQFGSLEAVRQQRIIKVTNRITLDGALFNTLRARRPVDAQETVDVEQAIAASADDPFCHPEEGTPADVFGRVRGRHCLTASNIARYDGSHCVLIFDEHHPLRFARETVHDAVETAMAWACQAHSLDPQARYLFFLWNCLWRSGASIIHGHAQAVLTRGMHYAQVERWRRSALWYRLAYGVNYFDDLIAAQEALGLVIPRGDARILPSLTPIKDKETLIIAPTLSRDLLDATYDVLDTFVHRLGMTAFNLALYLRPIDHVEEDWNGFPAIVRLEDRGDPRLKTSDLGAMELFASSVVAGDPFQVADAIREHILAKVECQRIGSKPSPG